VQIADPKTHAAPLGADMAFGFGIDPDITDTPPGLRLTVQQRDELDDYFMAKYGKDMPTYFRNNISSSEVRAILRALAIGPLAHDVELLNQALAGLGTNEMLLTELLLNREQEELNMLIEAYKARYSRHLVDDVKSNLSGKLERLFVMALNLQRAPDSMVVDRTQVSIDVDRLIDAAKGKEAGPFIEIFVLRNRPHLAAVITAYGQRHKSLSKVVKKTFSGALEDALLYILHGLKAKRDGQGVWRDAKLLEQTMAGLGTRNAALVYRVLRAHWDRARFARVQKAYRVRYGRTLEARIRGDTSGAYREALVMLVKYGA